MNSKPEINIVVVGHLDHGKSTIVGRILYDIGILGEADLRRLEVIAEDLGKKGSEFAFALDTWEEERKGAVTIDTRSKIIETHKKKIIFIDVPGHRKWIRNMLMGSIYADAFLLTVSIEEGVCDQTQEHVWLCNKLLNIDQAIVAITKMDKVGYDKSIFEKIKEDVEKLLLNISFGSKQIKIVPIAGLKGDNLVSPSKNLGWWLGPTLLEALEEIHPQTRSADMRMRFLCLESFTDIQSGKIVASGDVLSGIVRTKEKIIFQPSGKEAIINKIKKIDEELSKAKVKDRVSLILDGIEESDVDRGYIAIHMETQLKLPKEIRGEIYLCDGELKNGDTVNLWIYGRTIKTKIKKIMNSWNLVKKRKGKKDQISKGEIGILELEMKQQAVIEERNDFKWLSSFILLSGAKYRGYGNCVKVMK